MSDTTRKVAQSHEKITYSYKMLKHFITHTSRYQGLLYSRIFFIKNKNEKKSHVKWGWKGN